jgi:hypothetical protein
VDFKTVATVESLPGATPEQDLWIAVIKQAIYDYAFPRAISTVNERRRSVHNQRMAQAWIFLSPDFEKVCTLAGIEPDRVRHIAKTAYTTDLRRQGKKAA